MKNPKKHIFVCASFRTNGIPQGICHKRGSHKLLLHLENEIAERGLPILISSTGCLKLCEKGPVMLVYPEGHWYGNINSEEDINIILDCLESEKVAEKYLIL
ncbi:MAG: (2Fe-2S) ferredoxin domain-containing protein [Chitinispirillaceae bacterium]|nr:(2Fe-2S) ferredoxin domain-containing protein [Chitinispirillaceae bacterium]